MRAPIAWLAAAILLMALPSGRAAQAAQPGPADHAAPPDARAQAPQDLTGYWVSLVTEDWRFRMLVADPGDTESVPLNAAGLAAARAWNPAQARADAADACKAFGAAGLMRIPGRLQISWTDGNTLELRTDSGSQTRQFHFDAVAAPAGQPPSLQGFSIASWEGLAPRGAIGVAGSREKEGYLKVETTNLEPGYLRTNGVPYSADTRLVEYYDSFAEPGERRYLVITSVVQDRQYLTQPFVTSSHFQRQPDARGWDPTPCRADVPR